MTVTWGLSWRYGDIRRTILTTDRSFAVEPTRRRVLAATRESGGQMAYAGESSEIAFQPQEIALDVTHLFVVGPTGVERHTQADAPVFANLFEADCGLGQFIAVQGSYLIIPCGMGGVQTINKTTGAQAAQLLGVVSTIAAAAYDQASRRLWVFDDRRSLAASIQVGTAGQLTLQQTFSIPNCRQIARVVFDSVASLLFVVCRDRIVTFSTANWLEPEFVRSTGKTSNTFTDFVRIGTDAYWIGTENYTAGSALPAAFGAQYGSWDSVNSEMQIACPTASRWNIANAVPYFAAADLGDEFDAEAPPDIVLPPPPVITSGLSDSTEVSQPWSYTITATGAGPITYGVTSPPAWLTSINPLNGEISGTPPTAGVENLLITATNSGGTTTETLVLSVIVVAVGNNTLVGVTGGGVQDVYVDGFLVYVVGDFTSVIDASGTYSRGRGGCLDTSTGLWTAWNPQASSTLYSVHKMSGGSVYVLTRSTTTTLGGVAKDQIAKLHPDTGALQAFSVTFDSSEIPYCFDSSGATLYIGGEFNAINGVRRVGACSFTNDILDAWEPHDSATPDWNLLSPGYGAALPRVLTLKVNSGGVFLAGIFSRFSLASLRTVAGWCTVHPTNGVIINATHGVSTDQSGGQAGKGQLLADGKVAFKSAAFTAGIVLATGAGYGTASLGVIASSGAMDLVPDYTETGATAGDVSERLDGSLIIAAGHSAFNGSTDYRGVVAINRSTGATDTGFQCYTRASGTGGTFSANTAKRIYADENGATVIAGNFGNYGAQTYDGTPMQGILIVNQTTGARL